MFSRPLLSVLAIASLTAPTIGQQADPPVNRFASRSNIFQLDLPAGWRQLAPNEVAILTQQLGPLPTDVVRNEPNLFYAIGPIDRWREGTFDGSYIYVVEQDNEWIIDDDFAERLTEKWRHKGEQDGIAYELSDIGKTTIGQDGHEAIPCIRRSQPDEGSSAQRSIDVYAPTGGRQISLSFTCLDRDFAEHEPLFRQMVDSLTFSRKPRGEPSLEQRLWPPLVTGAIVGLALLLLYRRSKRVN